MIAISSVHSIGLSIRILISASIYEYQHCAQLLTDAEAFYQWKKKLSFIESSKLSERCIEIDKSCLKSNEYQFVNNIIIIAYIDDFDALTAMEFGTKHK